MENPDTTFTPALEIFSLPLAAVALCVLNGLHKCNEAETNKEKLSELKHIRTHTHANSHTRTRTKKKVNNHNTEGSNLSPLYYDET
jgi:choline-glycine betaine transporter